MKFVRDEQDWGTYSNFIEEYSSFVVKKILSTCLYYNVDVSSRIFFVLLKYIRNGTF